jgi:hypothetical protein
MVRALVKINMKGDKVRHFEARVQIGYALGSVNRREAGSDVEVGDAHPEGERTACHLLADAAKANNEEHLSRKVVAVRHLAPTVGRDCPQRFRQSSREHQDKSDDEVSDGVSQDWCRRHFYPPA